ncbi:MATE family efflux transporter [Treponema pedis]|uniref:MATE family transporter n=1 Tax=Treponema pedis str. T A4 TaxID=1291379 RepID=S6A2F3_9SPIR|nr:MATE family efflux transporter [Treponema pedis]AGT42576.1 MATE family transporter [Treponema pedis str. T A4]
MDNNLRLNKSFFDKEFLKMLFTIALPIILQNLLNSFVNILDTVMIGRLGTVEIAAVGLGNQLFFLLNLILYGTASGGMVFTAQFWGKKDLEGLRKTFGLSLTTALFFSTVFTLVCMLAHEQILSLYSKDTAVIKVGARYLKIVSACFIPFSISFIFIFTLRAIEQVKAAVTVTIISLSVNLVLNAILIFGLFGFPALGVEGAAVATVAARATELVFFFIITKKKKYPILGKFKEHFLFSGKFLWTFFLIVLPVIFNESLWSLGMTFHHKIFAGLNTFSYAAFSITNTVSQLTWVVFIGLGNGISVLIGKKIGEGNYEAAKSYALKIAFFAPFSAIFVGAMLIPISFIIPYIFNVEKDVLIYSKYFLAILAMCYPLKAFNMSMLVGVIRAGGDTKFGVVYDTLFLWIISVPLAFYLSVYTAFPSWFIYLCLFADEPIKASIGLLRLKSGKWLHRIV